MIIYQIVLFIFMIILSSYCETSSGILCVFSLWMIVSFLSYIVYKKGKKMSIEERIYNVNKYKYKEIYYNNFGKLP